MEAMAAMAAMAITAAAMGIKDSKIMAATVAATDGVNSNNKGVMAAATTVGVNSKEVMAAAAGVNNNSKEVMVAVGDNKAVGTSSDEPGPQLRNKLSRNSNLIIFWAHINTMNFFLPSITFMCNK